MHARWKIAGLWRRSSFASPGGVRGVTLSAGGVLLLWLAAISASGQTVTTTVTVGTAPTAVAVNPVTNKVYISNATSNNVSVIDGATNTIATVATGTTPKAIAVNPATNKIYVANNGGGSVTVINGADNTASAPIPVGTNPSAIAINPVTNVIYVVNTGSNNVSVINGSNNTVTTTVSAGTAPNAVAVNPVTNKIYVTNKNDNSLTVINGADNSTIAPITVGTRPSAVAVNAVTDLIYVANFGSNDGTNSVTVIDANNGNLTTAVNAGFNPSALAINPVTNQIYVANPSINNVTVINGADNTTTPLTVGLQPVAIGVDAISNRIYVADKSDKTLTVINAANGNALMPLNVGTSPVAVGLNPVTNKIYAVNNADGTATVVDGATNATNLISTGNMPVSVALNPVSNKVYVANQSDNNVTVIDGSTSLVLTTVSVGAAPVAVAVNPSTNKIYVVNQGDNNVSVIDGTTDTAGTPVDVGAAPTAIAINPVTNQVYVVDNGDNTVTQIDGASNVPTMINVGNLPTAVAVNPVSNQIYVVNQGDNKVTVIDGATTSATPVSVGANPVAVAVNSVTNTIYVVNKSDGNLTVIDGATNTTSAVSAATAPVAVAINSLTNRIYVANSSDNSVTVIDGSNNTPPVTFPAGTNPSALAVNLVSNKIYVVNNGGGNVSVIDGATNTVAPMNAGTNPVALAVNPVSNMVYVANQGSANVTVLSERKIQPVPLTTSIAPSSGNQLTFTTNSSYSPVAPPVQNVYFQFDSWQGPWLKAAGSAPNFTGAPSTPLLPGIHIVYAYAADGQFADSIQPGGSGFGQSSPIPGAMAAFLFLVVPEPSNIAISSSANPSVFGQPVTFTATVTSNNFGTPGGTVIFMDGATTLATIVLNNAGVATFNTSTLALGSHTIQIFYSGDQSFLSGSSQVIEVVNKAATSSTVTLTSGSTPSSFGQTLTFTASVLPQFTGIPTGTVSFVDAFDSSFLGGGPIMLDGSGQASVTVSTLAVGSHDISVAYSGDTNFIHSASSTITQVVKSPSISLVALTSGSNPSNSGDMLTFTAIIGPQNPSVPTGTVTFLDNFMNNTTVLASNVPLSGGQCSAVTSSLAPGVHQITVVYGGDITFAASTSVTLTQVVMATGNPSSTGLTVNGGASSNLNFGFALGMQQSADFVISVTGSTDGDSVVLLEGNQQLGPVLTLTGGQASWNSQLRVGVHNVQAIYIGNGTSAGSISTGVVVNRSPRPRPR
ncbi:MAG TPA: Ig-like domain repeat protein [Terriglobales bacterium]|jgi:YVTN family beta-propeller protein|nr:Ig-like domain repeat protein [Terriglobales bacterium]